MSVQFIDLAAQQKRIKPEIDRRLQNVLAHGQYILGPEVDELEEKLAAYCGSAHCITVANGTDALQIAQMAIGIKPGDEVITPAFSYVATAETIALLGAKPVYAEIDPQTYTISAAAIEGAITPRTKAIIAVSLFGQCADFQAINTIAKAHELHVIEDAAQSFGARQNGRMSCNLSEIACTSFFPSKPLGCYGDGGAIFTNDDDLAHTIRGIVNHGMYERYYHDVVGVNSRLDSIQAAVLRAKLPKLDGYNESRWKSAMKYSNAFQGQQHILAPKISCACGQLKSCCDCHVFHQYTLRILNGKRDALVKHLNDNQVPCGVYYPVPLHKQKAYADSRYDEADFPVTNQLIKEVISLPMHTELDDEQIKFITDLVIDFVNK